MDATAPTAGTTTEPDETTQTIRVTLDVAYEIRPGTTILDAMGQIKELVDKAREYGEVSAEAIFGRKKFPL